MVSINVEGWEQLVLENLEGNRDPAHPRDPILFMVEPVYPVRCLLCRLDRVCMVVLGRCFIVIVTFFMLCLREDVAMLESEC